MLKRRDPRPPGSWLLNLSGDDLLQHMGDCPTPFPPLGVPLVSGLAQPQCWAFLCLVGA